MAIEIPFEVTSARSHADQIIFDTVGLSILLTDLNQGGILRSLAESVAIQLENLDSKVFFGIQRAIPTILYTAFGFPRLAPVKATGTVTFNRVVNSIPAISIPKDTVVIAPALDTVSEARFVTLVDATIAQGKNSIDVPVAAELPGTESNVSAGRIVMLSAPIGNVGSVINYAAIKNGADEETEEKREIRFRKYVLNLARSPLAGIEVGATLAQVLDINGFVQERVDRAIAVEPPNTLGRVALYIDNGGGAASSTLVTEAQKIIDGYKTLDGVRVPGYKAAGIVVEVSAVQSVAVAVTAAIEIDSGYSFSLVAADVQNAIEDFFLNLGPGDELILVDLLTVIATVPGVRDLTMATPSSNQNVASSQRLLAGTVTLSQL
jgi:uncharacterized phage protein gp47/JayE